MKNMNIKLIVVAILILSIVANPVIMTTKNDTAKAYYQEDLLPEDLPQGGCSTSEYYDIAYDDDPALIVEAGGPYQTVPGGLINFNGYFELLAAYINVTGYTWDFGDGESFTHEYDPTINSTSVRFLCPASHLYPQYGHYTARLTIHYTTTSKDGTSKDEFPVKDLNYEPWIISSDTATVDVEYDPWDEQNNPNNYFKKQVWDEQDGWSETTNCSIGDPIQFKISYTATGRIDNVEIKDYLPPTVRFVSAVPSPDSEGLQVCFDQTNDYYIPTRILLWDVGDMYAGETVEIVVNGIVEYLPKICFGIPDDDFPIYYKTENKVTLKGTKYSPGCGNPYTVRYTAFADFTIVEDHPDLKIEKFVKKNCCGEYDPDMITVNKGEWVTFWLKVTNTGDFAFEDVTVTDNLPAGLSYLDNARVNGVAQEPVFIDDYTFYWYLGTLDVDETVDITFQANADECGLFRNVAFVKGYYDCQEFTDEDDAAVDVNCTSDVVIEKTVRETQCDPWVEHVDLELYDEIYFKIDVTNTGETVLSLIISEVLPDNLVYINNSANYIPTVSGQTLTWLFVDVNPDEHIEIIFKAEVVGCGFGINWAYVFDREQNVFDENNATVNVICPPDLEVIKTVFDGCEWVDETTADVGEKVRFRVVVENTGLAPLYNFTAIDTLPAGLTYDDNATVNGIDDEPDEIILNPDGTTALIWYFPCDTCCDPRCEAYPVVPNPCGESGVFVPCDPGCCGLCYLHPDDPDPQPYPVGVQCGYCAEIPVPTCDKRCETVNMFDPRVQESDWVPCNPECCWGDGPVPISGVCGYNSGDFIEKPIPTPFYESCSYDSNSIMTTSSIVPQPCCPCECFELYPKEAIVIEFDAIVDDCGVLENNVVITANDKITDVQLKDEDNATVNVACEPGISVDKKVKWNCCGEYDDYIMVHEDDWVTFKIETTNTGDVPLDIRVEDSLPIGLIYDNHATPREYDGIITPLNGHIIYVWEFQDVEPGETIVVTFRAVADECGELANEVNVTGVYEQIFVYDEDEAFVFVSCPDIGIVKEANETVVDEGDSVTYTYTVTNTGNTDLYNVVVTDDQGLIPVYVSGDDGDNVLQTTETWVYEVSANIDEDVTNIGTVTGEDELGTQVTDDDDAFVDVIHPDIKVVKTVTPCCVLPGETATWNITVENTGDVTLTNVFVIDDNIGALGSMLTLASGDKLFYEYTTNPLVETTNTVLVNGTDSLGLEVTDTSTATIELCESNIDLDIEKIVKWNCLGVTYGDYIFAHVGDWVTFKITIENTGDVSLNLTVCDILPDSLTMFGQAQVNSAPVDPVDMCWIIDGLGPGEKVTVLFRATVDECGEHINNVIVTGSHEGFEPIVKQDNATVFAICPDIDIVKTADSNLVCVDDEVTYTYSVTNTGNHHLKNVVVIDDKISGVTYVSGDTNTDDWLDIDETWIYIASSVLCENTTNTANVSAEDEMDMKVYDEDTEFVEVIDCQQPPELDIEVVKKVKENCCGRYGDIVYVHQGGWVTFKLEVTNTGEEALSVVVEDVLPVGLTYNDNSYVDGNPASPNVDGNTITWDIGSVGSGVTVEITFEATVDCQACGSFINTVYVSGIYQDYPEVTGDGTAEVFVLCPGINIEKTADPTNIHPGEEVTYTYEVSNTGNCPLTNLIVMDDKISVVDYVSGDTNTDGWLDVDEIWIYQATANPTEDVTNMGNVTANDELGEEVYAEDDAFVDVQECGCVTSVSIDKKVYYNGEWSDNLDVQTNENHIDVTFKITVENTGTCDLENISIIDTYDCGIEDLRDFVGDFISYEIIGNNVFFTVNEPFTSDSDPLVILFNATVYINTTNHVEVLANSTYDGTHVCEYDAVTITINEEETVNNEPYKPVDPNPENPEENVSVNPTISIYVEDPDDDALLVSFYNASDDSLIGESVSNVPNGTRAEIVWSDLEYEAWYSWYAVVDDGEYTNTSDVFTFKTKKDTGLDPTVKITTPKPGSIYFRGNHILAAFLDNALVIGGINITVDANDSDGEITNIDFIIDGEIKNSTTNTYYYWNEICFGWRTITVKVTDNMGNTAEDEIDVFMISRGL